MICEYPGCGARANWKRCRAHVALFVAAFRGCVTRDEHDRLARLPWVRMLVELSAAIEDHPDRDIVIDLIRDAQEQP